MARKHTPKGGAGGKRPGAGRPPGSTNVLGLGEVAAVKALGLRVPESARPEHRAIADEAFETIVSVMRGEIYDPQVAAIRRNAAKDVREEICGPVKQKVELSGSLDALSDEQLAARYAALVAKGTANISGGAGTTAAVAASQSKGDDDASLGPDGDGTAKAGEGEL